MIQMIIMVHRFNSDVCNIYGGVQDGGHSKTKLNLKSKLQLMIFLIIFQQWLYLENMIGMFMLF